VKREIEWATWALRVAVAFEFFGHGWLAFWGNGNWVPFVTYWGFSVESAPVVMRAVGVLDWMLAVHVLVRPVVPLVAWMAFWGLFTALLRPLTGQSLVEFVERGANFGAPLALLLLLLSTRVEGRPGKG
jgi:hypothetical protein